MLSTILYEIRKEVSQQVKEHRLPLGKLCEQLCDGSGNFAWSRGILSGIKDCLFEALVVKSTNIQMARLLRPY